MIKPMPRLSGIYIYPIKSTRGIALSSATVGVRGLQDDRRYLVVDQNRHFITGRKYPNLTQVTASPTANGWRLQTPGQQPLTIVAADPGATGPVVHIWNSQCAAVDSGDAAAEWFSRLLVTPVRLVEMTDACLRLVNPDYGQPADIVSFADGYPLLLTTEASLTDLNRRTPQSITMARFRPNLVISDCEAYAEDDWQQLEIGNVRFEVVKACQRCVFTTIDPDSGQRDADNEPLRTLATYRRRSEGGVGVYFGQNLIPRGLSQGNNAIHINATVTLL